MIMNNIYRNELLCGIVIETTARIFIIWLLEMNKVVCEVATAM